MWDLIRCSLASYGIGLPYIEAAATKASLVLRTRWDPRYYIITMIDDALAFRQGEDIGVVPV